MSGIQESETKTSSTSIQRRKTSQTLIQKTKSEQQQIEQLSLEQQQYSIEEAYEAASSETILSKVNIATTITTTTDILKLDVTYEQKTSIAKKQSKAEEIPGAAAFGLKLKKAQRVQRESVQESLPFVDLKHHEFEAKPKLEEVGLMSPLF